MTTEIYIDCPQQPGRKCTLKYCLDNPNKPGCVEFSESGEAKPKTSSLRAIGEPGGPVESKLNRVLLKTGGLN